MSALPLSHCDMSTARLWVEPVDIADQIGGDPIVRYASVQRTTDGSVVGLRDFSVGQFRRRHVTDEIMHVVEGGATVVDDSQRVWVLRQGDVVTFRQGTSARWQVPEYIRALTVTCRESRNPPAPSSFAANAATTICALVFGLALASVVTTITVAASMLLS